MQARLALLLLAWAHVLCGCAEDARLFLQSPFAADQIGVVVVTDAGGQLLGRPPSLIGAGRPLALDVHEPDSVRIFALAYARDVASPEGSSLLECGVALEPGGVELPPPREAWSSPSFDVEAESITLDRLDPSAGLPFRLRYSCGADVDPCAGVSLTLSATISDDYEPFDLVSMDAEEVLVSGAGHSAPLRAVLLRVSAAGVVPIPWDHGARGSALAVGIESPGIVLLLHYGAGQDGELLRLSLDGRELPLSAPRLGGPVAANIAVGPDGTILAQGSGQMAGLVRGSTVAVLEPFPAEPFHLTAVGAELAYAVSRDRFIYRRDAEGWRQDALHTEAGIPPDLNDIDARADFAVAVASTGDSYARLTSGWELLAIEAPPTGTPNVTQALSGQRFLAGGESGLALWNGRAWCSLDSSHRYLALDESPDPHVVFALSSKKGAAPRDARVMRLVLP